MTPDDRQLLSDAIAALEPAQERFIYGADEPEPEIDVGRLRAVYDADQLEQAREFIAKAEAAQHDRAAAALASLDRQPVVKSNIEHELAAAVEHSTAVDRFARAHDELRDRPQHATSWLYREPTATPEQAATMLATLGAGDRARKLQVQCEHRRR